METKPWVGCFKKMGIGGVSQLLCLYVFFAPFHPLLIFFSFCGVLSLLFFSVDFFPLCLFNSFSFSQSPFVTSMSHPPSLNCFLFFIPTLQPPHPLPVSLSSPSQMGVYIPPCPRWRVMLAPSAVRLVPRNSWRQKTFGCWVSRRSESCRNCKAGLFNCIFKLSEGFGLRVGLSNPDPCTITLTLDVQLTQIATTFSTFLFNTTHEITVTAPAGF